MEGEWTALVGGPSLRASGSLFASESMRGTPWRGPGSLLCDLIWRVPGPPFPTLCTLRCQAWVGGGGKESPPGATVASAAREDRYSPRSPFTVKPSNKMRKK
ncbi:unnamed protein product [Leuciscus chuanchicus]